MKSLVVARVAGCLTAGLVLTISCAAPTRHQPEDVRSAIEAANTRFMATFASGDAPGMAALYTQDGQLLPPNSGFVTGPEAIGQFWQAVLDAGVAAAELSTVEVVSLGDHACEVGRYSLMDGDGNLIDSGKYIVQWEKVAGEWKLHRDIWNTSQPPPEAAAEEPEPSE